MLESFRRGQRWLTGIFIAVIGGVFVFFLGLGGPLQQGGPSADFVVQIDDIAIDRFDFERVREAQEDRMRDALGADFNERSSRAYLDQQTLRGVVEQAILAEGMRQNARRARVPAPTDHPMRLPLQSKVTSSEFAQKAARLGVDIAGAWGAPPACARRPVYAAGLSGRSTAAKKPLRTPVAPSAFPWNSRSKVRAMPFPSSCIGKPS